MTAIRTLALLGALCALLTLPGCTSYLPAEGWPPRTLPARARPLKVGVARAQITPPPGVSLFGHGPNSRVANGVWTRLYCRAFVFETQGSGRPGSAAHDLFAMVSCDLPAISTLLQRTAVHRARKLGVPITAPRLLLSATHTHAGPGHYFGAANYNGMMSARLPGFDRRMLDFLAGRVALALKTAHERLQPGRLAWAHKKFWNFTRNRSLVPFRLNQDPYIPEAPADESDGWFNVWHRLPGDRKAIDPHLDTLWIFHADNYTMLGSISFLAMHPTMLGPLTQFFSGDIFGVVSRDLDARMREHNRALPGGARAPPAYHGVINTNSGDMAAIWSSGSTDEVITRGQLLAKLIWGQREFFPRCTCPASVGIRYTEAYLPGGDAGDGNKLCQEGELGFSAPKGATDHSTVFKYFDLFNNAQLAKRCVRTCQEPKKSMLWWFQGLINNKHSFPRWAPLATVQLAGTLIAFVPAELTITAGHRVRQTLARRASERGLSIDHVLVAGHTNGYIQYVTTEEEYFAQYYEGASNLYGPHTLGLLKRQLTSLVDGLALGGAGSLNAVERAGAHPYDVGTSRDRMPRADGEPALSELKNVREPITLCRLPGHVAPTMCFIWSDGAPARVWWASSPPGPEWSPKKHWIEVHAGQGDAKTTCGSLPGVDNDEGYRFTTRVHERSGRAWIWSASYRFTRHRWDQLAEDESEVCIRARHRNDDIASRVHTVGHLPVCSPRDALFCADKISNADRQ